MVVPAFRPPCLCPHDSVRTRPSGSCEAVVHRWGSRTPALHILSCAYTVHQAPPVFHDTILPRFHLLKIAGKCTYFIKSSTITSWPYLHFFPLPVAQKVQSLPTRSEVERVLHSTASTHSTPNPSRDTF